MLDQTDVWEFVNENFQGVIVSRNGRHFQFRCPFCGDSKKSKSKKRFHLEYYSDQNTSFNCFNCNESGDFYKLYAFINGIDRKEAFKVYNKFSYDYIKNSLSNKTITSKNEEIELPDFTDFIKEYCVDENTEKSSFKINKGLEILKEFKKQREITDYPCYFCFKGKYENRIIIPVFENDKCIYYQGRAVLPKQEPKYLNPSIEKEHILLNRQNFDLEKWIIITEGILDALSIGDQGTSVLGASLKDEFIQELFKYTNKGIILALDNDEAGLNSMKNILKNSKYSKRLNYFFLKEYKDLNEFKIKNKLSNENVYKYIINNNKTYFETEIYLKL